MRPGQAVRSKIDGSMRGWSQIMGSITRRIGPDQRRTCRMSIWAPVDTRIWVTLWRPVRDRLHVAVKAPDEAR